MDGLVSLNIKPIIGLMDGLVSLNIKPIIGLMFNDTNRKGETCNLLN